MNMKKRAVVLTIAMGLLTTTSFVTASAKEIVGAVGMPNPMVSYDTVQAAAQKAGFTPLYLPEISGYHVTNIYVISGNLVDIAYAKDGDTAATLRVRTAKATKAYDDISGIYSVTWQKKTIDDVTVYTAELPQETTVDGKGYAAHWTVNGMAFSVQAEKTTVAEFQHVLSEGLVDLSVHYF